jgi:pimeloyl-ACP methyl ester carboxylesterase
MPIPEFTIHEKDGFRYVDEGPPSDLPPVVLLHGMLGDLSNWTNTIAFLAEQQYRVLVPVLPVYEMPIKQTSVRGLATYLFDFLRTLDLDQITLVGNSLGGQVALLFALHHPDLVAALVLSGSSGLYEAELGSSTPRRRDREYIRERAALTFYDPVHATDDLVEEMFDIINNRAQVARLIRMARSTKEETVRSRLSNIGIPTLLVWGRNDLITPPEVAVEFKDHISRAELHFIEECGHAPMIEQPEKFNYIMLDFLRERIGTETVAM